VFIFQPLTARSFTVEVNSPFSVRLCVLIAQDWCRSSECRHIVVLPIQSPPSMSSVAGPAKVLQAGRCVRSGVTVIGSPVRVTSPAPCAVNGRPRRPERVARAERLTMRLAVYPVWMKSPRCWHRWQTLQLFLLHVFSALLVPSADDMTLSTSSLLSCLQGTPGFLKVLQTTWIQQLQIQGLESLWKVLEFDLLV